MQNTFKIHIFVRQLMKKLFLLNYTQSVILIAVLAAFQFFFRLDKPVVREWDEATYGVNAYEMLQSGNPIVVTFQNKPDLYNSKPPFGLWLMAGSIKLFGFNTFGLRFASAFISFLLVLFIFQSIYKTFKKLRWATFSALILLGSIGFTGWHEARSGDFDAMVAAFIFCYVWFFIKGLYEKNGKAIFFSAVFLSMACLTKGIYGLVAIPVPALLSYLLIRNMLNEKKLPWIYTQAGLYAGITLFLTSFLGYYFYRAYLHPGYLQAVLQNEVGERFMLETHIHKDPIPFYYHTFKLLVYRFEPFILLLPFAVYGILKLPKAKVHYYLKGILLAAFSVWVIISFSKTKLVWYDGSIYPLLAVVLGWYLSEGIAKIRQFQSYIFVALFLIVVLVFGLNQTEKDSFTFPFFLRVIRTEKHIRAPITVYAKKFEHPIWFYSVQEKIEGNSLTFTGNETELKAGQMVCTFSHEQELELKNRFTLNEILRKDENVLFQIQ